MLLINFSNRLSKFLMVLAAMWAFALTFIIISDIIGRSVFNSPVYGVREIVMNSVVIIVFLQVGYAIRSRSMLKADFLVNTFPGWLQKIFLAFGYLLGAAFFATIVIGSIDGAIYSWVANEYEGEGALHVPVWPTRFTILLGGTVATANYLIMAYLDICKPEDLDAEVDDTQPRHDRAD